MCTTLGVVGILLHNFGDTEDITNFEAHKCDGDREDITNFEVSKGDVDNCSPVRIIYGNTTAPGEDFFYREILFAAPKDSQYNSVLVKTCESINNLKFEL